MKWFAILLTALLPASSAFAEETRGRPGESFQIPYKLTNTKHVLVRVKLNDKGPFNFIIDTGAPALFVATRVGKQIGIKPDGNGWGTFDRFEIEGGAVLTKAKGRIEDPFQLEGMNGMGMAGSELHGIIGYNIIARYRIEFDFTRDKMTWTQLNFDPGLPPGLTGGQATPGGLGALGGIMKMLGGALGRKAEADTHPRGILGIEVEDKDGSILVTRVLDKSPAAEAGLKNGDRIERCQDKAVAKVSELQQALARVTAGETAELGIKRAAESQTLRVKAGKGL